MSFTSKAQALLAASTLLLGLLGTAPAAGTDVTAVVSNVAPTIVVTLAGLSSGSLLPVAGTTAGFTATIVVTDLNGASDVTGVTVGVLDPSGNVHSAETAASLSSSGATTKTFTKTVAMNYYDSPGSGYKVSATATDASGATGTNALALADAAFTYASLVAVSAPSSFAVAGSGVAPGQAGAIQSLAVGNRGNVQIDTQVSGTDLAAGSDSIPVGSIAYSLASDLGGSAALTSSATTISTFNLAASNGASKNIYFRLTAPEGLPPGSYTGTLTVTGISG